MFSICHPIIVQTENMICVAFIEIEEKNVGGIKRHLWDCKIFSEYGHVFEITACSSDRSVSNKFLFQLCCWLFFMKFPLNEGFWGQFPLCYFLQSMLFIVYTATWSVKKSLRCVVLLIAKSIHESHLMS